MAVPMLKSSSTLLPLTTKAVGGFTLAAHRHVSGVQIAGRRGAGASRHDDRIGLLRTGRNHARLQRQQIGEAAAVQGNIRHLLAGERAANLRVRGVHKQVADRHFDRGGFRTHFQLGVEPEGGVRADGNVGCNIWLKAGSLDGDLILTGGKREDCISALDAGPGALGIAGGRVDQLHQSARDSSAAGVHYCTGNAARVGGESGRGDAEKDREPNYTEHRRPPCFALEDCWLRNDPLAIGDC